METLRRPLDANEGPRIARLAEALLGEGLSVEIRVTGSSMSPFIQPDDVVVLDPLGTEPVRIGQVLCFLRDPDRLAIHRVIARGEGEWILRGDGASLADRPVKLPDLLGRVSAIRRAGRRVGAGLGPAGILIAFLSKRGMMAPLVEAARRALLITRGSRAR